MSLFAPLPQAQDPTVGQALRIVGHAALLGSLKLLGALALLAGVCATAWGLIKQILEKERICEVITWGSAFALILLPHMAPRDTQEFMLLPGSGLLAVAWLYTAHIRAIALNPRSLCMVLALAWGSIACHYHSTPVGFLAVVAVLGTLGFYVAQTSFCTTIGFKDEDSIVNGSAASLILVSTYITIKIKGHGLGILSVFEPGILWLGTLAFMIGLLIISSEWYRHKGPRSRRRRALVNAVAASLFAIAILLGAAHNIRPLSTLGVFLGAIFFAEKIIEIPSDGLLSWGMKLLFVGGGFVWLYLLLLKHQDKWCHFLYVAT